MTKDDPSVQIITSPRTMEENAAVLKLNLNEPLTDQLAKHRFMQDERTWREGATEAKRQTRPDGKPVVYAQDGKRINYDYIPSEIVDLGVRKNLAESVVSLNSGGDRHGFYDGKTDLNSQAGGGAYEMPRLNSYEKPTKNAVNCVNGSTGDEFKDQSKSSRNKGYNSKHSFGTEESATNLEATGKAIAPPPPLKKTVGGGSLPGAKPGSAFLPVDQQSREFISGISTVYKTSGYPFCVLPFPMTSSGPVPHPLLQSPAPDHRLLAKVHSPNAGTPLSPYPDAHMTHRLELLWQKKYPHLQVPPVWMLYQYMDELLRDTCALPLSAVDRLGREFYGVSSMNSMPVIPSPVDSISTDKRRERKEVREKNFPALETNRTDGINKEELQTRKKNDCKDRKNWRTFDSEPPPARDKNKPSSDWYKLGQNRMEFLPGAQVQHQRTELLIDKSVVSAGDAVDQHFQESLLRLNSQNHLDKSRNGRDNQLAGDEKHIGVYGNSSYQNWNDGKCAAVDAKAQNDALHEQARPSSFDIASHLASRTLRTQPGQINFDIYGYQSQRPVYSPEKVCEPARKDSFAGKSDKSAFKNNNGLQEHLAQQFSVRNSSQDHHPAMLNPGFAVGNARTEAKDLRQDGWSLHNAPQSKIPDKANACLPTKRKNDVKFSTGSQSVASPTPGSVVKDSRLGPSRLIATSPRPLPSLFYNPLDPRMEPVHPYQVSIEPVERWSGSNVWTQVCPPDWSSASQSLHSNVTSNGVHDKGSGSIPPKAHTKIQKDPIPSHVHNPAIHDDRSDGIGFHPKIPGFDKTKSMSVAPYAFDGTESQKPTAKRYLGKDSDAPQCLKKVRSGNSDLPIEGSPLVSIDSFKSFVDQAVYNAFLEDSDRRPEPQKILSGSPSAKSFSLASIMEPDLKSNDREIRLQSAPALPEPPEPVTTIVSTDGFLPSDPKTIETIARSSASSGKIWSHAETCSDTLSTLSCETSASDEPKCETSSVASINALQPPALRSPPSPRTSGSSLHLKKAWLARYSDIDQRPSSEAPASGNPGGSSTSAKHVFADKPNSSVGVSKFLPFEGASEDSTGFAFDSIVEKRSEVKPPVASVSPFKIQSDNTDSNSGSEVSVDSNRSKTQNSEIANSKRKSSSEVSGRRPKLAKTGTGQKASTINSRQMRGKYSKISEGGCAGGVASDGEAKPNAPRKKTRVRNTRALDQKDENLNSDDQGRVVAAEVFLQEGSCLKVAQRLPKCRECKTQKSNKNFVPTGNICKFDVFRKLCYNGKGLLNVAGFLEPSDIEPGDVDLWTPSRSKQKRLTPIRAQYLMSHLKEFFAHLLQQDTSLKFVESSEEESGSVLWRRPMEGVQETCDACDTVVFDVHWTCKKCGFVVCSDCYGRRIALDESGDASETEEADWPPCSARRQSHDPDDLLLTQIIPQDALSTVMQIFDRFAIESKSAIKIECDDWKFNRMAKSEENGAINEHDSLTQDIKPNILPTDVIAKPSDGEETRSAKSKLFSDGNIDDCGSLLTPKEEKISPVDLDSSSSMPSLDFHVQLVMQTTDGEDDALRLFQRRWCQSVPVVARICDREPSSNLWKPEFLLKKFNHLKLDLVSCLNGTVHRFQSYEKLWNGSKSSAAAAANKTLGLLQFKDWPMSDDWIGSLGDHCADLSRALPIAEYVLSSGAFNLAAHLPEFFHQPELATRINVGYGNLGQGHVTLTKMQTNPVDFVNIVMYAERRGVGDDSECDASHVARLLKDSDYTGDTSAFTEVPERIVAIWHTYNPTDTSKIQAFLDKVGGSTQWKNGEPIRSCVSSDSGCYLDAELQEKMRNETGVKATVVVQCLGDAVFVPATSFYQIKVIQECVSVTKEFISAESVESAFAKSVRSSDPTNSNTSKNNKQEHFQIKNLVYHTMKDCLGVLDETKL